jgi:hypothetical protein
MRTFLVALLAGLISLTSIPATDTMAASDGPILRIDGALEGPPVSFTRAELEALGTARIRTATPWHDGVQEFEGVPMARVMQATLARGTAIEVVALNKYRTAIPMEDFQRHQPILALKRGGQYMDIKDKGPLFIIYPYDARAELKTETYYSRSAWQVATITVK